MMRRVLAHAVVIVAITNLAAAAQPTTAETPGTKAVRRQTSRRPRPYQVGRASWYGKRFHGKKTASGEAYDMFQFTAAHRALPLGTLVKVTNLSNGQWVIVRVNDRGPNPKSRIIDLSYGAAQMLGLRLSGVEQVRLDVVETDQVALAQDQDDEDANLR